VAQHENPIKKNLKWSFCKKKIDFFITACSHSEHPVWNKTLIVGKRDYSSIFLLLSLMLQDKRKISHYLQSNYIPSPSHSISLLNIESNELKLICNRAEIARVSSFFDTADIFRSQTNYKVVNFPYWSQNQLSKAEKAP
jgi:hypothetical protein